MRIHAPPDPPPQNTQTTTPPPPTHSTSASHPPATTSLCRATPAPLGPAYHPPSTNRVKYPSVSRSKLVASKGIGRGIIGIISLVSGGDSGVAGMTTSAARQSCCPKCSPARRWCRRVRGELPRASYGGEEEDGGDEEPSCVFVWMWTV